MDCVCFCFRARRRRRLERLGKAERIVAESYAAGKLTPEGEVFLSRRPNLKDKASQLLVARHNTMATAKNLDQYVFVFQTRLEQLERQRSSLEDKWLDLSGAEAKAIERRAQRVGLHLAASDLVRADRAVKRRKLLELRERVSKCKSFLERTEEMLKERLKKVDNLEQQFQATVRAGV